LELHRVQKLRHVRRLRGEAAQGKGPRDAAARRVHRQVGGVSDAAAEGETALAAEAQPHYS